MGSSMRRAAWLGVVMAVSGFAADRDWEAMAERLVQAVKARPGERALARFHRRYFRELEAPIRKRLKAARVRCDVIDDRQALPPLDRYTIFFWMPLGEDGRQLDAREREAMARWLDGGGTRRSLHMHWSEGTRRPDGLPAPHTPELDAMYERALAIDYAALRAAQDRAIEFFRKGTIRVLTPHGTDLMFRTGVRPWNRQDGDASPERAASARLRVDRDIEYPAGVIRVAPIELTPHGVLVLPEMRVGAATARRVALYFDNGRISAVKAAEGQAEVEAYLKEKGDSAMRFREFALGLNPELAPPAGAAVIPYFGYGAGVVRISLGDNEELGGSIRGGFARWFFLPDASVHVDNRYFVRGGRLAP